MSNKKNSIINYTIAVILVLAFALVMFCIPSQVSAEEKISNRESIKKSSLIADMYADKRHIGEARISTYLHLKSSGDGLFMVEGEIQPKINDGSHDYKVRWFTLDVQISDAKKSMTAITYKDNSKEKIVTSGSGASLTIGNEEVSFNISNSSSMTYSTSSVNVNYSHYENIKGEKEIDKSIHVEPIKSEKDTTYSFTTVFFFKYNPSLVNTLSYNIIMKEMRVDGIVFAPDYGTNSSEALKIQGNYNLGGTGVDKGFITDIGSDGSPNDWLSNSKFNEEVF